MGFSVIDALGRTKQFNVPSQFTFTTTGNIDDLDFSNADLIRANNATLSTIRGLKAGYAGQEVTIASIGAGQVNVSDQNANSAAANRIITGNSATHAYDAGKGTVTLRYDAVTLRWRVVSEKTMRFRCWSYQNAGTQTLPNNATTAVTLDTDLYDFGDIHSVASATSKFTIPVGGAGHWSIAYHTGFITSTNARFIIGVNKNGASVDVGFDLQATPTSGQMEISASAILHDLVEGDYIEMVAYQNTGIAVTLNYSVQYTTHVAMHKLD